jgi:hypothetical protein
MVEINLTIRKLNEKFSYLFRPSLGKIKKGGSMNIIDLKEKEVFKKEDRGFANLVDEKYLQIN